jgi:hypothetical protein
MDKVREALNKHAESLLAGSDSREALLEVHPRRRGRLAGLFDLAGRVRNALAAPVEPPPDFVADLKRQLMENAAYARAVTRHERTVRRRAVALAAGAGGTIYLLGLVTIVVRSALSVVALISALAGRGRRKQARGDV